MLLLQILFSLNFVSAVNRYIFFHLHFMLVFLFLKLWTVPCILLLVSCVFFSILSPIYFLSPCSTLIFKQVFTLEHVTRPAFHCLSSKVYSLTNLFWKIPLPFFRLPSLFWTFFFLKENVSVVMMPKCKHLYVWEDFFNYSFTLKWHHPECVMVNDLH